MPKISELILDQAPADVPFDGGSLHITYRPRVITTAWQQRLSEAETAGADAEDTLYAPIKDTIVSWDLELDDGSPCPLTSEALAEMPRQILMSVLWAVVASARPNQSRPVATFTDGSSELSNRATRRRTGTS